MANPLWGTRRKSGAGTAGGESSDESGAETPVRAKEKRSSAMAMPSVIDSASEP